MTLPPAQNVVAPPAVIDGVDGFAFTVTVLLLAAEQPLESVTVTESVALVPVDVNVTALVPLPPVIEPPLIVQV